MKNKIFLQIQGILILLLVANLNLFAQQVKSESIKKSSVQKILFNPEKALIVPFDSIFQSLDIVNLQSSKKLNMSSLFEVRRTNNFLVANTMSELLIFDMTGRFVASTKAVAIKGNIFVPNGFYADDHTIIAFNISDWVKYDLNGNIKTHGKIPYSTRARSFLPLNESTWLFYNNRTIRKNDSLRLWTTDTLFNLKKRYLEHNLAYARQAAQFVKNIHYNGKDIYLSEEWIDTVYRFNGSKILPEFVFDLNGHKVAPDFYSLNPVRRELKPSEAIEGFTIITDNAIVRELIMGMRYFLYFNRYSKTTKTIQGFSGGPDLLKFCRLVGSDTKGRLYWVFFDEILEKADGFELKYKNLDLLQHKKAGDANANPFLIITTFKK